VNRPEQVGDKCQLPQRFAPHSTRSMLPMDPDGTELQLSRDVSPVEETKEPQLVSL
jgi:hypothetical protein